MTTLGERITRAVTGSAIDPAEIAKACEVTVQSVYGWMRGEVKDLKNEYLFSLADKTGFSARWIGTGQGPEIDKYAANERVRHVLAVMEQMPEMVQAEAVRGIDSLAQLARALKSNRDNHDG